MKILALIRGTLRELAAKATLYVLAGISTVVLLLVLAGISSTTTSDGRVLQVFGNPISPPAAGEMFADAVNKIEAGFVVGLFLGVILFGMFSTAGIIPDALEKGTVDLYLSKPVARWELLAGKYLGGVTAILANVIYFIGLLWLIVGLKVGVWNGNLLIAALLMTFVFACLFAIVAFFGVFTRNMAISIIAGFLYLFIGAVVLQNRQQGLFLLSENIVYRGVIDGLYYAFPQIPAMQTNIVKFAAAEGVEWQPFLQSLASSGGILGLTAWLLHKKDF